MTKHHQIPQVPNVFRYPPAGSEGLPVCPITPPKPEPRYTKNTAAQLAAIPDLLAQVGGLLEPGTVPPDPDARKGTTSPARPPIRLDVVDLLEVRSKRNADDEDGLRDTDLDRRAGNRRLGVLPTLGCWVSMVHAELQDLGQPTEVCCSGREHTVIGEVTWLTRHLDWILDNHQDFAGDIDWMFRDLLRACGVRPEVVLACPMCGWRLEGQDGDTWFRCTGCPKTWRLDAELRRLGATLPPMTLRQLARLLSVPLRTLYNWESEKRFLACGTSPRGGKLYDPEIVKRVKERAGA